MIVSDLLSKQIFSRTYLVDEYLSNLLILLFLNQSIVYQRHIAYYFKVSLVFMGNFPWDEYPQWVKEWVKPGLSLRLTIEVLALINLQFCKVFLASQSGKVWQVNAEYFFLCCNDVHQKVRPALRLFTPDSQILSLFIIIEQDYDELREKIGCFISYFEVLTSFTRSIYW